MHLNTDDRIAVLLEDLKLWLTALKQQQQTPATQPIATSEPVARKPPAVAQKPEADVQTEYENTSWQVVYVAW